MSCLDTGSEEVNSYIILHRRATLKVFYLVVCLQSTKAGNGGVKVREFVDIFCAHPPKPRKKGRRNQQMFTTPNAQNSASAKHEGRESLFVSE